MKKMKKLFALLLVVTVMGLALVGCDKGGNNGGNNGGQAAESGKTAGFVTFGLGVTSSRRSLMNSLQYSKVQAGQLHMLMVALTQQNRLKQQKTSSHRVLMYSSSGQLLLKQWIQQSRKLWMPESKLSLS